MKTAQLSHNAALLNTIFAICMGFTIAEDTADDGFSLTAGVSKLSLAVVSCTMIAVWIMVVIIFCWTLRKEIHDLFIKCWTTTRADRSPETQAAASLNDIIFDPEEEQQASLSQTLLPSSTAS